MAAALDTITISTDGRALRRERNRDAVLDAVIASFEAGDIDPLVDAVAARAGVSNRSIYRYFEDRDHLIRAAVRHAMHRIVPEMTLGDIGLGSFEQRVGHFVDHHLGLYCRLARIIRAAKHAAVSEPSVAEEFEAGRLVRRRTLLEHFAEEFDPLPTEVRSRTVIAAEMAFQFDAFEFLWTATDGRVDEMRAVLVEHLRCCLGRVGAVHRL